MYLIADPASPWTTLVMPECATFRTTSCAYSARTCTSVISDMFMAASAAWSSSLSTTECTGGDGALGAELRTGTALARWPATLLSTAKDTRCWNRCATCGILSGIRDRICLCIMLMRKRKLATLDCAGVLHGPD